MRVAVTKGGKELATGENSPVEKFVYSGMYGPYEKKLRLLATLNHAVYTVSVNFTSFSRKHN